jgi:hypothetical protein
VLVFGLLRAPRSTKRAFPLIIHLPHISFRGDSRFQMDYLPGDDRRSGTARSSWRTFGSRTKCTVPCGGVGMLPREKVPSYEIRTACSACTHCYQWSGPVKTPSGISQNREMIDEKEKCEAIKCCEWEEGNCNAAKTGLCTAESSHTGGASSRIDGDTELSPESGISCKVEPGMPQSSMTHASLQFRGCFTV